MISYRPISVKNDSIAPLRAPCGIIFRNKSDEWKIRIFCISKTHGQY